MEESELESDDNAYPDYDEELLIGIQRTQAVSLSVIISVSVMSNSLMLLSLFLCNRDSLETWRPTFRQLLCHICAGDLAYAFLTMLPRTINIITFPRFYGGYFMCRLVKFLQLVPVYVCPFLVVVCCVSNMRRTPRRDEAVSIFSNRRRFSWREGQTFAHVLSFYAWLTAMVLSAPNILAFRYEYLDDTNTVGACVYQVREAYERWWMMFLTCATWLIPFFIVFLLYSILFLSHYVKKSKTRRVSFREGSDNTTVLIFFAVITFIKFVLWTPFNIINIIGSYWKTIYIDENVSVVVTLISNCSCCATALAYLIFDGENIFQNVACLIAGRSTPQRNQLKNISTVCVSQEDESIQLSRSSEIVVHSRNDVEESSVVFTV